MKVEDKRTRDLVLITMARSNDKLIDLFKELGMSADEVHVNVKFKLDYGSRSIVKNNKKVSEK